MKHLHKHVKNYLGYAGHHHGHPDFDLGLTCGAGGAEFSFVQAPKIQNGRKGCSWQLVCATMRWMQMVVMTAIRIMVLTMLMIILVHLVVFDLLSDDDNNNVDVIYSSFS